MSQRVNARDLLISENYSALLDLSDTLCAYKAYSDNSKVRQRRHLKYRQRYRPNRIGVGQQVLRWQVIIMVGSYI